MTTLRELGAHFVISRFIHELKAGEPARKRHYIMECHSLKLADGLWLDCPACVNKDGHGIVCWFDHIEQSKDLTGPGRWHPEGTGIDDLSFVPWGGHPRSVQLCGGCSVHFHITHGSVQII